MSDTRDTDQQPTRQQLRAEAKAEQARRKAMRPWYRKKRYIIPLALVALIIVAPALGGDGGDAQLVESTAAHDDTSQDDSGRGAREDSGADSGDGDVEAERATIGEPADDGQFRFVVDGIDCGRDRVGGEFFRERAQGQFCLLAVSVENIGDQAGSLFADNQYLIDGRGNRHSADSPATLALDPEGATWYEEINPGNNVSGEIVFDVPRGRQMVEAELHDSAFSGGVLVDLR